MEQCSLMMSRQETRLFHFLVAEHSSLKLHRVSVCFLCRVYLIMCEWVCVCVHVHVCLCLTFILETNIWGQLIPYVIMQNIEHIYWTITIFFPMQFFSLSTAWFKLHRTLKIPIAPGCTYCFEPPICL